MKQDYLYFCLRLCLLRFLLVAQISTFYVFFPALGQLNSATSFCSFFFWACGATMASIHKNKQPALHRYSISARTAFLSVINFSSSYSVCISIKSSAALVTFIVCERIFFSTCHRLNYTLLWMTFIWASIFASPSSKLETCWGNLN